MRMIRDEIEDTHMAAGVLLNCLLLYAIRRFSSKSLGSYKQLLTIFAIVDVLLCIEHTAAKPKCIIIGTTFAYVSNFTNRDLTALYCSFFSLPFALMNIHFIYRFWAIRYPHLISLFSNKRFIALITMYPVIEFIMWFFLISKGTEGTGPGTEKDLATAEVFERYGMNMTEGWIVMNHWKNNKFQLKLFLTLMAVDTILFVSLSVATVLGVLTYYHISRSIKISTKSRDLQKRLLYAVSAQTFVPFIFVYTPYFFVFNLPFFNLPRFYIDEFCCTFVSSFPAWDAIIMLLLMKDYRYGLFGMVWKRKKQDALTTLTMQQTIRQ